METKQLNVKVPIEIFNQVELLMEHYSKELPYFSKVKKNWVVAHAIYTLFEKEIKNKTEIKYK